MGGEKTPRAQRVKRYARYSKRILVLGDILVYAAVYYGIRDPLIPIRLISGSLSGSNVQSASLAAYGLDWVAIPMAMCLAYFVLAGHYSQRRIFWNDVHGVIKATLAAGGIDLCMIAAIGKTEWLLYSLLGWGGVLLAVPLTRYLLKLALIRLGLWHLDAVVVGAGRNARLACMMLLDEPLLGLRPVLALDLGDGKPAAMDFDWGLLPVEAAGPDLNRRVQDLGLAQVIVAPDDNQLDQLPAIIDQLSNLALDLHLIPPMRGLPLYGSDLDHLFGKEIALMHLRDNLSRRAHRLVKRLFDLVCASILCVVLAPLFLFIAYRIRAEDGGPVLYAQGRLGRGGRTFPCFKFRSMVVDAEKTLAQWREQNPQLWDEYVRNNFKIRNDPRVTRVGAWLRAKSLDELPQIWNVLRGEMSLVGPRPLLARETGDYGGGINHYLRVRPGITGLWQVSGRSHTTFAERAAYDGWYIKNWSLWYDIIILLRTVRVVLKGEGAY